MDIVATEFKKQYIERTHSSRVAMMLEGAIDTSVPGGIALAPYVSPVYFLQHDLSRTCL